MPSYVRPGIRKCAKNRALSIFFVDRISASYPLSKVRETRVLTVYMIIGCVILLGTAFILPRHRAVGRRPVLPD